MEAAETVVEPPKDRHRARDKAAASRKNTALPCADKHDPRRNRSRVTNGKQLFVTGNGNSPWTRRFKDVLSAVTVDLGGADNMSEAQRQLARRCTSLSIACEKLEELICTGAPPSPADAMFRGTTGGLSPYDVLNEASRILHGIARVKGGARETTVHTLAALPDAELARVTELLRVAGDLASKAISAGTEHKATLELYGVLADRCGRSFQRLGLERRARDITQVSPLTRELTEPPIIDATTDGAATVEVEAVP
jgi:hypothetical protein